MAKNAATHFLNQELAITYGLDEAIFLNRIVHWIQLNKDNRNNEDINKRTFRDGKYWTYNTQEALCKQFPFWNRHQIMRITKSLIDKGVIIKGKYNKHIGNHTIWYALANEELFLVDNDCKDSYNRNEGNLQSRMSGNLQSGLSENSQSYNDIDKKKQKEEKLSSSLFIDICKRRDKGETLSKREQSFLKKYQEQELEAAGIEEEKIPTVEGFEKNPSVDLIETDPQMLQVLEAVQRKYGDSVYNNWFKDKIKLLNHDGKEITLAIATRFIKEWIATNYMPYLTEVIKKYFSNCEQISLIVPAPQSK